MPIYEYQCGDCGHRMEALQKISDAALKDCPACHSSALVKLVSASSFRLKGGGWYETDFKTGAKRHGTQEPSGEASAPTKPEAVKSADKKRAEAKGSETAGSEKKGAETKGTETKSAGKAAGSPSA